jgi:hypothetical protein
MLKAMMVLYAEALTQGAEGAARFLASGFEERFGRDIEEAMLDAGWTLSVNAGERRFRLTDA